MLDEECQILGEGLLGSWGGFGRGGGKGVQVRSHVLSIVNMQCSADVIAQNQFGSDRKEGKQRLVLWQCHFSAACLEPFDFACNLHEISRLC